MIGVAARPLSPRASDHVWIGRPHPNNHNLNRFDNGGAGRWVQFSRIAWPTYSQGTMYAGRNAAKRAQRKLRRELGAQMGESR